MVNLGNFRPRVAVIPDGWEQHHKPTVDGTRTATVEVWSGPAEGESDWEWDPVVGDDVPNHGSLVLPDPVTARIQRLLTEDEYATGGQNLKSRRYLVTLDRNLPTLTPRARLRVVQCDPELDGKYLHVLDIQGGSLRFERDLICIETL